MTLLDAAKWKGRELHGNGLGYTKAMGRCPWQTAGVRQAFAEGWIEAERIANGDPHTPNSTST